jgi:recombinational DNA repair protein RecT
MANELTPRQAYEADVSQLATAALTKILGSEEGGKAAARVGLAFRSAAIANPDVYGKCSRDSVANCVALSAMTGLMPGGPNPSVYLVPKGGALNWWLSHRGLLRLARTAGYDVRARVVMKGDEFEYEEGERLVIRHKPNLDGEFSENEMRGVIVQVYRMSDNQRVGADYVSKGKLDKRRAKSMQPTSGPWKEWAEEMYLKSALKYVFARGSVHVAESTFERAIEADQDIVDTTAEVVADKPRTKQLGTGALDDALADARPTVRETVTVEATAQTVEEGDTP